ncbi:50S ribosomal protein L3 [bacterium AB1]|nr:50S ribosomal protein L3 [bacterium AB1]
MIYIVMQKIQNTSFYNKDKNQLLPVVILKTESMKVLTFVKKEDGSFQIRIGYFPIVENKLKNYNSSYLNSYDQKNRGFFKIIKEFNIKKDRVENLSEVINILEKSYNDNSNIDIQDIVKTDFVKATGYAKGRGFMGNIKRHNFGIQGRNCVSATHRASGSTGSRKPSRTFPGRKMPGRENYKTSVKSLKVHSFNKENNCLFIIGSVPGNNGAMLTITPNFFPKK